MAAAGSPCVHYFYCNYLQYRTSYGYRIYLCPYTSKVHPGNLSRYPRLGNAAAGFYFLWFYRMVYVQSVRRRGPRSRYGHRSSPKEQKRRINVNQNEDAKDAMHNTKLFAATFCYMCGRTLAQRNSNA